MMKQKEKAVTGLTAGVAHLDDLAKGFQKTLQKQGMEFKLGQKAISAEKNVDGKVDVVFEPEAGGKQETMTVDVVLVSIGRKPYTTGLGKESGLFPSVIYTWPTKLLG
jgi:pyruvate/2-oxoglutarate dehydrogenase complex dihydrolipoamide dehydrogenase (E3) component